ncbi:exonuclease SbcCD subunit D [Candidatus Daviesbacteria bacterium]|nr:exonuclease SbcCD subunit D [Candidatus Daviesbacteria bacterium]
MKLLHFSDLHIGMENYARLDPETGLSSRLLDFFATLDFIVELSQKEEVDAVLFAGDAYKTRDPNPTQQRGFGERIKKLAKFAPVVLVVGNHDTPNAAGKANTLDIYSTLEINNVYVSRKPELLQIPTKSGPLQIVTLPWLHKNDYKTIGDKIHSLYEKIKPDSPAIFLSHAEVEGASFGSEKGMAIQNDVTIPLSLLTDRRLHYVALGHIHKHQVLSKDPLVVYSGSPQRIDFGEEKEEKGACLVEISGKKTGFKFIPTNARKFLTIEVNLKPDDVNPTQTVLEDISKHEVMDKIVRIVINIPADLNETLQMDLIKKTLKDTHFIAGISRNVERKERLKIDGQEEVERLTPLEALKKYFSAKQYDKVRQKELLKFAEQLF